MKKIVPIPEKEREKNRILRRVEVDVGDLVLLINVGKIEGKSYVLGVFADFVDNYVCVAEQPFRLRTFNLPGNLKSYSFFPATPQRVSRRDSWERSIRLINGWEYNFAMKSVIDIIPGKDNIVQRLKTDSEQKYLGHIEVMRRMKRPYVNDPEILRRLEALSENQ